MAYADFNNDNNTDLVVGNFDEQTISILLDKDDGTFPTQTKYATNNQPLAVLVNSFINNHILDIIVLCQGVLKIEISPGNDDETFEDLILFSVQQPSFMISGDFNDDNIKDILAISSNSIIKILFGDIS